MAGTDLTAQRLRELLDYNPDTGVFTWRVNRMRVRAGDEAGSIQTRGYWQIRIRPKNYTAHRLVWLHVYGEWPKGEIDHINGDRVDNRLSNLRDVPKQINIENRRKATGKSGLIGAYRKRNKWTSGIRVRGKSIRLGVFDTAEEAHAAYVSAKRRFHEGCTI